MKKLILTTLCIATLSTGAFAQGTLNFGNSSLTLVSLVNSLSVNLGAIPAGVPGTFRFELFVAPAGTLADVGFVASGVQGTNLTTLGRINGGNGRVVPGTALGGTSALLVRGWSASLGTTWAQATANWTTGTYIGSSSIAPNFLMGGDGGAGAVPNSPIFGAGATQITQGFNLYAPVPEPTSMVLAGLGAASLLLFRRRS